MGLEQTEGMPELFPLLLNAAEQYLAQIGLSGLRRLGAESADQRELELEDVTAFIQVSGGIQGGFLFSVDHSLSRELAKRFMVEEINDVEAGQYAVEVVAEIANIVSAHSLREIEDLDIYLGNPLMLLSRDMGMRASVFQTQIYAAPHGRCRWIYIPKMDKAELASIVTVRG